MRVLRQAKEGTREGKKGEGREAKGGREEGRKEGKRPRSLGTKDGRKKVHGKPPYSWHRHLQRH